MDRPVNRPENTVERGFHRLMMMVGGVMMITPTAELAVQVHYHERPQVLLLGGFFLVGVLTVSHALSRGAEPRPGESPRGSMLRTRHRTGDPLWVPDSKD